MRTAWSAHRFCEKLLAWCFDIHVTGQISGIIVKNEIIFILGDTIE